MKEQLQAALQSIASGNVAAVEPIVKRIKQLERGEEGLFQTASADHNLFEAARLVYPVYAAYETECNKKEGYPDLLAQMSALKLELERAYTLKNAAAFLDALLGTIENVSPQLYEYYRALVDLFKETVKSTVKKYYCGGHFIEDREISGNSGTQKADDVQKVCGASGNRETQESGEEQEAEKLLRAVITRAAELNVLLGEKYAEYFTIETV